MNKLFYSIDEVDPISVGDKAYNLAQEVWNYDEVLLVTMGSYLCLRSIYFQAKKLGKENQTLLYLVDKKRCLFGLDAETVEELRRRILTFDKKYVVIYLSCLDIITAVDYSPLVDRLEEDGIQTFVLERGPLVKGRKDVKGALMGFLSRLEDPKNKEEKKTLLPPLTPDIVGIANLVGEPSVKKFLLNPGGCGKCWKSFETPLQNQEHCFFSKYDHIESIFGLEERVSMDIKQIASEKKEDQVELYVTNSTTISGLDEDGICENIEEAGHRVNYIKGDFLDYYRGTSTYLTKLAKSVKNYRMDNQGKTLVFGLNKNTFGSFQAFEDSLKFIEDTNEFSLFQKNEREGIKNIWCPSIEGYTGAKNLGDRLNVPIYLGLPLGVNQTKEFFQMLGLKERSASSSHNDHSKENLSIKNVAILLDPWQGWKLSLFLKERGINSSIYTYAPENELEEFFKASPHGERIKYFSSGEDLKNIGSRHSYFVGDPLFFDGLKEKAEDKIYTLSFPQPPLSGNMYSQENSPFYFYDWDSYFENAWISL